MALTVYWYDFICFGIVGAAFVGSLWVLWRKEVASRYDSATIYESLLVAPPDPDGFADAIPMNHVGSAQLWTSCWKGFRPGWLLATRIFSFLVMAGFLLWDIADWDATIFMYYTEWAFALVMVYFALASATSGYGIWFASRQRPYENGENAEILRHDVEDIETANFITYREKEIKGTIKVQSQYAAEEAIRLRAGFWGYLTQTIYQTCAGAVILTDIVFWCVIVPFGSNAHLGLNVLMGCMHTLNAVFLLLDTALNNLPFPWFRLAYFVQWSCLYVVFQWVIHACGFTWWPYPFLELDIPWAPLWYFALAVVHIPCYGIYALIVKAKNSIFPRWFPRAFVRSY